MPAITAEAAFVPLEPVRQSASLIPAVANCLRVRDQPGLSVQECLAAALAAAPRLLLLDGAEHLRDAVADLAGAAALLAGALAGLRRAGTNVEPWLPSTALVTTGVYRFTRNPIYLAMTLLYLAVALAADSLLALLLLVPLLGIVRHGVIGREEHYLDAKFGESYRDYRAAVRRWF